MWKVIGTKTQKPPLLNRHGSWQLELVLQVAELFLKYQIIIICLCRDLLQQACLPQEESLHLKQTVPMLVYDVEWKCTMGVGTRRGFDQLFRCLRQVLISS